MSLHYARVPAQPWPALERLWLTRLGPAKRAAILRLRFAADRNASLLGIALFARALSVLGVELEADALEFPRAGKPRLPGGPDFSVSHSGGLVACAVARLGRIGLDLELTDAVRAATVARVLMPAERSRLARGRLRAADAWVMKEAVVKAAGRGIGAMRSVQIDGRRGQLDQERYWLYPVMLSPAHTVWVARDRPGSRVVAHEIAPAELAALPTDD